MPATSTGSASATGTIVASCSVPSAGEFVTGAGLKTAIDPINDDLATVRKQLGGGLTLYANRPWFVDGALPAGSPAYGDVDADKAAGMYLPVPHGATVSAIQIRIVTQTHVSLPVGLPIVTLYKYAAVAGTFTTWTVTDAPADAANYSIAHTIALTLGTPETIDLSNYVYYLVIEGETGTNKDTISVGQPKITID